MDHENEEFVLPEDLQDVEVIYYENEGEDNDFENEEEDQDIEDISTYTFNSHEKSVFAVDISPDGKYVVSGGEDDKAFVWDVNTKEVLITCDGHKDSVTLVCFNRDGKYVATGDMSGVVNVWNMSNRSLEWSSEMGDIEWMQWHPLANVLIGGYNSGEIYVWQIPSNNCKVLASHGYACTCAKVLPDGVQLIAGYADGEIRLWNLKTTDLVWKKFFNIGITAIDTNSSGTLFGIAPISQLALIGDGRSVASLKCKDTDEIENILVNSELGVVITGSISGEVCIWNLTKPMLRHKIEIGCAVTVLRIGGNSELLIGAADGTIFVANIMNGSLTKALTGHADGILDVAVPKTGNFIVSSSDDASVKVFNL